MQSYPASRAILDLNRRNIPGGMFSLNRETDPVLVFEKGEGAYLWDADGNRFIDYHAAFGPYLLGHNAEVIDRAVEERFERK